MKMMKENRGLTLIELLITIAIIAIVIAAATSFMITGSRSFTKGSADSDLQKEAELTVNQIEDMIIDVNGGMDMNLDDPDKPELIMYHLVQEPDETGTLETKQVKESVVWKKAAEEMFYSKWYVSLDESGAEILTDAYHDQPQLLAENVSLFEVDLDTIDETASDGTVHQIVRSVQIRVGYENSAGRVDYATSPVITLRNRMLLSGNPADIFVEPPSVSANMTLHYAGDGVVDITPIVDYSSPVQRGGSYNIYAWLDGGTEINHLVTWRLEETSAASTIDPATGVLTVSPYETNEYLTVVATYKTNPNKYKPGILKVEGGSSDGKSLADITIYERWRDGTTATPPYYPRFGSYPTLIGPWETSEIAAIQYTWEVIYGKEYTERDPEVSDDGTPVKYSIMDLKIKEEDTSYNKTITIKLTAHSDVTGETVWKTYDYKIGPKGIAGGDSNMKRGLGLSLGGTFTGHNNINMKDYLPFNYNWPPARVTYRDWYFCDEAGNKLDSIDAKYGRYGNTPAIVVTPDDFTPTGTEIYYTLTFNDNLPPDQGFYVKVILKIDHDTYLNGWSADGGVHTEEYVYERIHHIPAVQLFDRHEGGWTGGDKHNFEFFYGLLAYHQNTWVNRNPPVYEYSLEELDLQFPEGVSTIPKVYFDGSGGDDSWGAGTYEAGVDRVRVKGTIQYPGLGEDVIAQINVKSMKVKVSMKGYPDIYTYVTVYFN